MCPFQFIIHQSSYLSVVYNLSYWQHRYINHEVNTFWESISNQRWELWFPSKVKLSCYMPCRWKGTAPTHPSPQNLMRVKWSVSHPDCALPLGKGPLVPIGQEGGWASELVWTQRPEEKSLGIEPRLSGPSQVLYWLSFPTNTWVLVTKKKCWEYMNICAKNIHAFTDLWQWYCWSCSMHWLAIQLHKNKLVTRRWTTSLC
jgi:hypothetical protein